MSGPLSASSREANNSKHSTRLLVQHMLIFQLDDICYLEIPRAPGVIILYPLFGGYLIFISLPVSLKAFKAIH